jgi:PadR family transcriptional regulator PadR
MPIHDVTAFDSPRPEVPSGTLELLILSCVCDAPQHGYAISRAIRERSEGMLLVEEGSLYPALHRLVRSKQVRAEWGVSENNRKARFYRITQTGRRRLASDASSWRRVSAAVTRVLGGAPTGVESGRLA